MNASIFLILVYSLKMTMNKTFTIGDFVLVTSFLQSFYSHLFDLVFGLRDIAKSYADIHKYFSILDNKVQITDPENPKVIKSVKGEIEFKNVNFAYDKHSNKALKNIKLKIHIFNTYPINTYSPNILSFLNIR